MVDPGEEPSQEESFNGEKEPPLDDPAVDQKKEPSLKEPVDCLPEVSDDKSEEPLLEKTAINSSQLDDDTNPDFNHASNGIVCTLDSGCTDDVPLLCISARSSSSLAYHSASCHFGCNKEGVPQSSTSQIEDPVPSQLKQLKKNEMISFKINSHNYEIRTELGEGGFGAVYAGTRLEDGLQVAIKFCPFLDNAFISIDGFENPLPAEIALHSLANKGSKVKEIIELLDWQVESKRYIMVLEHPILCQSLHDFVNYNKYNMEEHKLRRIMHQATIAAQTCCQRGVFHRDIKLENFLINPDTLEVKLIDFGCGDLLNDNGYTKYCGVCISLQTGRRVSTFGAESKSHPRTIEFCPPEFHTLGKYYWEPTTVWSLGIIMYLIIFRKFPDNNDLLKINDKNLKIQSLSKECCNFIRCCLKWDFKQRIDLQSLSLHDWFKMKDKKHCIECPDAMGGSSHGKDL